MGEIDESRIKLTNVPSQATELLLETHFNAFGTVKQVILATNIITKKSIPVAFVEFSLPEAAKRAILA